MVWRKLGYILFQLVCLCLIGAILVVAFHFVILNGEVPSSSMYPMLREGDRMIVDRVAYVSCEPQRGDVIVFTIPGDDDLYVKRISSECPVSWCGKPPRVYS